VILQEIQYLFGQEAAVRGEGVMRFDAPFLGQSLDLPDSLFDFLKGQKGLSAIKIDEAFPGKERPEKTDGIGQKSRIQPLPPFSLIAVRTIEIALIRQDDR
jgi:hypothetical protein